MDMMRIFTNHFHEEQFEGSRRAVYFSVFGPPVVLIGFFLRNPFSLFKNVSIGISMIAGQANLMYCVREDIRNVAREDSVMGLSIRERYKQLAVYDPEFPTFRDYT